MNNIQKTAVGLLIIFLIVVSFGLGFWVKAKQAPKVETPTPTPVYKVEPQTSKLIEKRYFSFRGKVSKIDLDKNALTLSVDKETIDIDIKEGTPVISYVIRLGEPPRNESKKVELKDIYLGDDVSVFAEEREGSKLLGTSVYIHGTSQATPSP